MHSCCESFLPRQRGYEGPLEAEPPCHLAKPTPLTLYGVAHCPIKPLLNMARQEEEMKVKEEELRSAMAKAQELLGKVAELEEKTATLSRENDLTDELQAVRGALGKVARAGGLGTSQTQKVKGGSPSKKPCPSRPWGIPSLTFPSLPRHPDPATKNLHHIPVCLQQTGWAHTYTAHAASGGLFRH